MLMQGSSRPLYEQLKQMIVSDIVSGKYKHGERLPGEKNLVETHGISRITVRRALAELEADGYLATQQGKGTFVNYTKDESRLMSFATISDNTSDVSLLSRHIISKEEMEADSNIARYLQVSEGTKLIRLCRVMSENGKPYMIDTAYFPKERFPGIYDKLVEDVSTFDVLKRDYGVEFTKAVKAMGVIRAGVRESQLLQCIPGDPLFSISKVIYDRADVPFHYSYYLVHGDRCVYTLTVTNELMDTQVHYQDELLARIDGRGAYAESRIK